MKRSAVDGGIRVTGDGGGVVSQAGLVLLWEAARRTGLARGLSQRLGLWRSDRAVHDPGKVVLDLAVAVAAGGDCAADIAIVRGAPEVFGPVASDPTVSRVIASLAADAEGAELAIAAARAAARERVWRHAGAVWQDGQIVIDLDATYLDAFSRKEGAAKMRGKRFGFHPLLAFCDHGPGGAGEPVGGLLRPGNAGAGTAADHITVTRQALAQLPAATRGFDEHARRRVLVRTDSAGATHAFADYLTSQGIEFSLGAKLGHYQDLDAILDTIPADAWTPAITTDATGHDSARVCEATDHFTLAEHGWPEGTRMILRKDHPLPGTQLAITDRDGMRVTGFLTNTNDHTPAALELRHRRHARVEDRIRHGKDTGLRNLPFHDFTQNRIWLAICALAADLIAFTQRLALTGPARRWEPKTLRLRLFSTAARLARTGRRRILRLARTWPWTHTITTALTTLTNLPDS